jgi:hypothetical protein
MSKVAPIYVAVVNSDKNLCRSTRQRAGDIRRITYGSAEFFIADTKHPQFGLKRYSKKNSIGA